VKIGEGIVQGLVIYLSLPRRLSENKVQKTS